MRVGRSGVGGDRSRSGAGRVCSHISGGVRVTAPNAINPQSEGLPWGCGGHRYVVQLIQLSAVFDVNQQDPTGARAGLHAPSQRHSMGWRGGARGCGSARGF